MLTDSVHVLSDSSTGIRSFSTITNRLYADPQNPPPGSECPYTPLGVPNLPTTLVRHRTNPMRHRTSPVRHRTNPVRHHTNPVWHRTTPVRQALLEGSRLQTVRSPDVPNGRGRAPKAGYRDRTVFPTSSPLVVISWFTWP